MMRLDSDFMGDMAMRFWLDSVVEVPADKRFIG